MLPGPSFSAESLMFLSATTIHFLYQDSLLKLHTQFAKQYYKVGFLDSLFVAFNFVLFGK